MTTSLVSMKRIPLLILALVALAAAGCGSSSKDKSSTAGSSSAPAAPAAASGGTVTIDMQNIAFNPTSVTVKVGQKVKWVNKDDVPHDVKGGPLNSKTFNKGGSFEFTPTKAETISYVCTIHPNMKATLTVTS